MAERMVACGWIAGAIAGLATLIFSLTSSYGLTHYNLVDAALLFGLAYGIYRRSRICAVLALAYHILNRLMIFYGHDVPPIAIVLTLMFAGLYVLGVIGTFVHHARRRSTCSTIGCGWVSMVCGSKPTKLILSPARTPWRAQNPPLTSST